MSRIAPTIVNILVGAWVLIALATTAVVTIPLAASMVAPAIAKLSDVLKMSGPGAVGAAAGPDAAHHLPSKGSAHGESP
jgi:hypothetical protein